MLGIAGFAGQLIVPELVNIAAFCFPGDLFQHRAGKNFRPKHRRDLFLSNLLDEPHHLAGARIGKIGRLDGADHLETIAAREIGPGIVIGEQATIVLRYCLNRFLDRLIQGFEFFEKLRGVLFVDCFVLGVETNQLVADQRRITHHVFGIEPQVRIGMTLFLGKAKVIDIFGFFNGLVAERIDGALLF